MVKEGALRSRRPLLPPRLPTPRARASLEHRGLTASAPLFRRRTAFG